MCLKDLNPGDSCIVDKIYGSKEVVRRITDIGITESACVSCVGQSPFGDPKAFSVRGAVIALREEDSGVIEVHKAKEAAENGAY